MPPLKRWALCAREGVPDKCPCSPAYYNLPPKYRSPRGVRTIGLRGLRSSLARSFEKKPDSGDAFGALPLKSTKVSENLPQARQAWPRKVLLLGPLLPGRLFPLIASLFPFCLSPFSGRVLLLKKPSEEVQGTQLHFGRLMASWGPAFATHIASGFLPPLRVQEGETIPFLIARGKKANCIVHDN